VEFLIERYGLETLKRILTDLGAGMPINESLQRYSGSLAELDQEFAAYAEKIANGLAPQADWARPKVGADATAGELAGWLKENPNNYLGLERLAGARIQEKNWSDAERILLRMLVMYPEDKTAYSRLAGVYREQNLVDKETVVLEKWLSISCDAVPAYLRLIELHSRTQNWEGVKRAAQRMLGANPLMSAPHRALAVAAEATGDVDLAIGALATTLRMSPLDEVDLHFRLARLLQNKGDLAAAKRHVLQALEEAPRFRAGHDKLLEIVRKLNDNTDGESRASPPAPSQPPGPKGVQ
jgi:tetratricopeptide (TPR) repeat protein